MSFDIGKINTQINQLQLKDNTSRDDLKVALREVSEDGVISAEEYQVLNQMTSDSKLSEVVNSLVNEVQQRFGGTANSQNPIPQNRLEEATGFLDRIIVKGKPAINDTASPEDQNGAPTLIPTAASQATQIDLSTPKSRLNALDRISQVDSNYDENDDGWRCSAACVVGGAMYSGVEGLQGLVSVINQRDNKIHYSDDKFRQIEKKLNNGEALTRDDISHLQHIVLGQLREINGSANDEGVTMSVVAEYINTDVSFFQGALGKTTPLRSAFEKNNLRIEGIDTSVEQTNTLSNHAVLFIGESDNGRVCKVKNERVYDPWPSNNGHQVKPESMTSTYSAAIRESVKL